MDDCAQENLAIHDRQQRTGGFVEPETLGSETEASQEGSDKDDQTKPNAGFQKE
jgi:hypothetical protein